VISTVNPQKVVRYVLSKRGRDGGYLYYQYEGILDSSVEDTYYAVKSLKLLGAEIPEPERTIAFLKSIQGADGGYPSIRVAYFAVKALFELGDAPRDMDGAIRYLESKLRGLVRKKRDEELGMSCSGGSNCALVTPPVLIRDGILRSWDLTDRLYAVEIGSRLSDLFMIVEGLTILQHSVDENIRLTICEEVLRFKNQDGGFGAAYSSVEETFYAIKVLSNLACGRVDLRDTRDWIRSCEDPCGGFKAKPTLMHGYLLSDLYCGLRTMSILRLTPSFVEPHVKFILKCFNGDGGFRNSIYGGSSSLESTFHALSALEMLGEWGAWWV